MMINMNPRFCLYCGYGFRKDVEKNKEMLKTQKKIIGRNSEV